MRVHQIGADDYALKFEGSDTAPTITYNGNTVLGLNTNGGLVLANFATGSIPATPPEGTAVWDSTLNVAKIFNGTTWDVASTTGAAAVSAEHGAGAIGTYAVPVTYRWTESGVIVTQIKIDLTGLASVATANDVIGLAAGGAAYIGRNVVATNGIIFKTEFSCIETPAGGDNDVNVVINSSAVLAYDGAGGTTYISNSGDLLAGQTIQNLVPALTADYYYYLTAGTGDTAGTYTAGQYILTTYGHAQPTHSSW